MKRILLSILKSSLPVLMLSLLFCVEQAEAEALIRIIGDKTTTSPGNSTPPMKQETYSSVSGGTAIRIIGDKQISVPPQENQQTAQPELSSQPPATKEIRIVGDRIKSVRKAPSAQPATANEAVMENKTTANTTLEEATPKETAEQLMNQRLAALKAEEERKAAVKLEKERLAKIKAEQEHEAARQAAIIKEQEQLAARKAEELRKNSEQKEQERLDAAKRILAEKLLQEKPSEHQLAGSNDSSTTTFNNLNTASGPDDATTQTPATIWDLYLAAKGNDPSLGRNEARVSGNKAESDLIFSGLLPHVDSNVGAKKISQAVKNYNSSSDGNYDFTALNYSINARMTLLNVPTLYSLSANAAGLNAEQAGVAGARQNLIVKLIDSYFSLLKAQTDKQIALGEINRLKQVLDQSQAFLKAGTGDIISVYEAQSRLDSAGADLTKSKSNLRLAEQKLSNQVGKPITEVVNYLPRHPAGPDPDDLDWWVATMEKEQPAIRQAREVVSQTAEQRKAAKAEYLPTIQASGGYDVNRGTAAMPTAEVRQWFVGASLSLPLYSGGETAAKVRRAAAAEEERRQILVETMDQHRENLKQAFFNLRYNISLIKALEQRKMSAEIQLAAVKKGRKIGTRNAIDVLNAEQGYSVALRDYRYALYDNIIRVIQLRSAAGILSEIDISALTDMEAPPPGNGLNMIISQASP